MRAGIVGLLLALAGCNAPGGNQTSGSAPVNQSAGNNVTPAPAPRPAADMRLVGRWADTQPQCARPLEMFSNGTVRASDGSRGHWRLERDRLTFNLGARTFVFTLLSVTSDRVTLIDANGQRGESVRCP